MYINIHNDSLGMSNIIVEEELETDEVFLCLSNEGILLNSGMRSVRCR
jgi:hypothetical protein